MLHVLLLSCSFVSCFMFHDYSIFPLISSPFFRYSEWSMDNQNHSSNPVEGAEIVHEEVALQPVPTVDVPSDNAVAARLNLEGMIHRYLSDIEKIRGQMKTQKEMLEAAFQNDATYAQQDAVVKAEMKKKNEIKHKILKTPAVAIVNDKVKQLREEIKDAQEALSQYVQKYQESTGLNQIMSEDGEVREIVIVTKLVRKSSK